MSTRVQLSNLVSIFKLLHAYAALSDLELICGGVRKFKLKDRNGLLIPLNKNSVVRLLNILPL